MAIPGTTNTAKTRVVFDADEMKQMLNERADETIDATAKIIKPLAHEVISQLPQVGAVVSGALQVSTTVLLAPTSVAFMAPACNRAIDQLVTAEVQYSQEFSAPRVDPAVDQSVKSTKIASSESIEHSVDATAVVVNSVGSVLRSTG
jgi:hypothetical protein